MSNEDTTAALSLQLPHTVVGTFKANRSQPRPFGGGQALLQHDFVSQLLLRPIGYDVQLDYALSVIAGWSYSDAPTLSSKLKYYGLPAVSVDSMALANPAMLIVAQAYFVRSECGRFGVLSFRGTDPTSVINWLTDADMIMRPFGRGSVHQGFYANVQAVWDEIAAKLYDALKPDKAGSDGARAPLERLYLTGHSLGGAMAVLATAKIFFDEEPTLQGLVKGVYTYGQPAVGDDAFCQQCVPLFGDRLFRHTYGYDVVPRLPAKSSGEFKHFGVERLALEPNDAWQVPTRERSSAHFISAAAGISALSFVTRRSALLSKLRLLYSLDDHSPTRYIDASRNSVIPEIAG